MTVTIVLHPDPVSIADHDDAAGKRMNRRKSLVISPGTHSIYRRFLEMLRATGPQPQIAVLNRVDMDGRQSRPTIRTALGRVTLAPQAVTSEWALNVGVRTAFGRVSRLMSQI